MLTDITDKFAEFREDTPIFRDGRCYEEFHFASMDNKIEELRRYLWAKFEAMAPGLVEEDKLTATSTMFGVIDKKPYVVKLQIVKQNLPFSMAKVHHVLIESPADADTKNQLYEGVIALVKKYQFEFKEAQDNAIAIVKQMETMEDIEFDRD
jgi:hypothetical protein